MMPPNDAELVIAARSIVSEWADLTGHSLCHRHDEVLTRLARLLGVPMREPIPPGSRAEFEVGCRAYQDFLFEEGR